MLQSAAKIKMEIASSNAYFLDCSEAIKIIKYITKNTAGFCTRHDRKLSYYKILISNSETVGSV